MRGGTASGEGFEELGRQGIEVVDELQGQPLELFRQQHEGTVDVGCYEHAAMVV
jgi:hypothetical protein